MHEFGCCRRAPSCQSISLRFSRLALKKSWASSFLQSSNVKPNIMSSRDIRACHRLAHTKLEKAETNGIFRWDISSSWYSYYEKNCSLSAMNDVHISSVDRSMKKQRRCSFLRQEFYLEFTRSIVPAHKFIAKILKHPWREKYKKGSTCARDSHRD